MGGAELSIVIPRELKGHQNHYLHTTYYYSVYHPPLPLCPLLFPHLHTLTRSYSTICSGNHVLFFHSHIPRGKLTGCFTIYRKVIPRAGNNTGNALLSISLLMTSPTHLCTIQPNQRFGVVNPLTPVLSMSAQSHIIKSTTCAAPISISNMISRYMPRSMLGVYMRFHKRCNQP